jgi:ribosomal protein S18 acetylase RimI-like enzyme
LNPINIKLEPINIQQVHLLQKISIDTFNLAFEAFNTKENLDHYYKIAFSIPSLIKQIENPNSTFHFVYVNGNLTAYTKINIGESQTEIQANEGLEVERLYIYPEYQNIGLGKQLLNEIKINAILADKTYMWLGVWENNHRAIKFYQDFGFKKFDSHIYVMGNDPQNDWMMMLTL